MGYIKRSNMSPAMTHMFVTYAYIFALKDDM